MIAKRLQLIFLLMVLSSDFAFAENATNCVYPKKNSTGKIDLVNDCGKQIEVSWCVANSAGECVRLDNRANINKDGYYSTSAKHGDKIYWDACVGANSTKGISFRSAICQ